MTASLKDTVVNLFWTKKDRMKKNDASSKSLEPKSSEAISRNPNALDSTKDAKPIEGAITPDQVCDLFTSGVGYHPIDVEGVPYMGPKADKDMKVAEPRKGILVNGYKFIPQFVPEEHILKDENGKPRWTTYDTGFLLKNKDDEVIFAPDSKYKIKKGGFLYLENKDEADFHAIYSKVHAVYKKELQNQNQEAEKLKEEAEDKKRVCFNRTVCGTVSAVILIGIGVGLYFAIVAMMPDASSGSSGSSQSNSSQKATTFAIDAIVPDTSSISSQSGTTQQAITRTYPTMMISQPVPIVDLPNPTTFQIISTGLVLDIERMNNFLYNAKSTVIFHLSVSQSTKSTQLICSVKQIEMVLLDNMRITDYKYDQVAQLLTFNLPKPINRGNITLEVSSKPSMDAFDVISYPCDNKKCSVFVNRKLSLLVPHFGHSKKHKWTVEAKHPDGVTVLTNSQTIKDAASTTSTKFQETAPLKPSELSVVILENLVKHSKGNQIESYLTSNSQADEVAGLVGTLEKALESKIKPTSPTKDLFMIVVIPAMEKYQFYGRNVAFVGTELLKSNTENHMNFVWRWVFRTIIYSKISSSDKNPSWIYEQSAVFLSTNTKSNHKNMWKKHFYESALESGHSVVEEKLNQSLAYEHQHRYFEKDEHIARVSTMLATMTSLGTSISGDPLTNLDEVRNNVSSSPFLFVKSDLELADGQKINVNSAMTCYVDSPDVPHVHFSRLSPTQVVIQRSDGGQKDRCDMHLFLVKGGKTNGNTNNKQHILLSAGVEKVEIESNSPVLLSGDSPSSAYGYSMDQQEFDKLLDPTVFASYDNSTLNLLAFNAFRGAAEGKLTYESLQRFMKMAIPRNIVSVDDAVDLWMSTVGHSHKESLTSLTNSIITSVLNTNGSGFTKASTYISDRFEKATKQSPVFDIEKSTLLAKKCGRECSNLASGQYLESFDCVIKKNKCSFDPRVLERFVCQKMVTEGSVYYDKLVTLYGECEGKPCQMPIISGILCSTDKGHLESWLSKVMDLTETDTISRQVVKAIFKGLVTNDLSKPLLFPYLLDNWYLLHKKFSKYPSLLGDIIVILASTISTREQLDLYKHFVNFYGKNLNLYREFHDQIPKVEKAVKWNEKYSDEFSKLFG